MSDRKSSSFELYRRVALEVRPYWGHLAIILFLGLLATPVALLMPLPLKIAVDSVIGSEPLPRFIDALAPAWLTESTDAALVFAIGLLLVVTLLNLLLRMGNQMLAQYTGEKMVLRFRSKLFEHAQRLSLAYHDSKGLADATYRIQYDAPSVQWLALQGIIPLITATFTLIGMIYVTAQISVYMAIIALAVCPPLGILTFIYSRRLREEWGHVKRLEWSALSVVQEVFGAIRVVKAFNQEHRELNRFIGQSNLGVWRRIRVVMQENFFGLLVGLIIGSGTAAVLYIGIREVQGGALTLGSLLLIMAYLAQLYGPLQTISRQVTNQQGSLTSAERAFVLLDEAPAVTDQHGARPIGRAEGAVAFRNVSFSYPGGAPVLRNVSFEVPAGSRIGIAGKTGAGKTTLLSLLMRFYDPTDGQILLDGINLHDYRLSELRDQFSIVLQEPVLFSNSVGANIAYACPTADMEQIVEAAKAANAHEFIMQLPEGYETLVGERGMRLSGGERQRIALARAFLKDAPILVLDEPTSSIDIKTEAEIVKTMNSLMQGRTVFMIAHRLNTLKGCDVHLEIESGCLSNLSIPYRTMKYVSAEAIEPEHAA